LAMSLLLFGAMDETGQPCRSADFGRSKPLLPARHR
jgi:hypothetical protein